jgi:hypothetical protein
MTSVDLKATLIGVFDAAQSHALASGEFDRVNGHEPKSAPGSGVTAALWVDTITPIPRATGLAVTSLRFSIFVRCYVPMIEQPQDGIDPKVTGAVGTLLAAYSGDFTLGSLVTLDLLGAHGPGLQAVAGYMNIDSKIFRAMTITLPCVIFDALDQAP